MIFLKNINVAVGGRVSMSPIDHAPWPFGYPLDQMACAHTLAICTLAHKHNITSNNKV